MNTEEGNEQNEIFGRGHRGHFKSQRSLGESLDQPMSSRQAAAMDTEAKATREQQLIKDTIARMERTVESENKLAEKTVKEGDQIYEDEVILDLGKPSREILETLQSVYHQTPKKPEEQRTDMYMEVEVSPSMAGEYNIGPRKVDPPDPGDQEGCRSHIQQMSGAVEQAERHAKLPLEEHIPGLQLAIYMIVMDMRQLGWRIEPPREGGTPNAQQMFETLRQMGWQPPQFHNDHNRTDERNWRPQVLRANLHESSWRALRSPTAENLRRCEPNVQQIIEIVRQMGWQEPRLGSTDLSDPEDQEVEDLGLREMVEVARQFIWQPPQSQNEQPQPSLEQEIICYRCKGLNHISRDCRALTGTEGDDHEGQDTLISHLTLSQIAEQCDPTPEFMELMNNIASTWDRQEQDRQDTAEGAAESLMITDNSEVDTPGTSGSEPRPSNRMDTPQTLNFVGMFKKEETTRVSVSSRLSNNIASADYRLLNNVAEMDSGAQEDQTTDDVKPTTSRVPGRLIVGKNQPTQNLQWQSRQLSFGQSMDRCRQNPELTEHVNKTMMAEGQWKEDRQHLAMFNWEHPQLNLHNALSGRDQPIIKDVVIIPTGVNGSVTPSLWDTGAGVTLLSERKAKELGIVPNDFRPNVSGIGGSVEVKGSCELDLQIFDMVRRVPAKIVDSKDSFDGYPFDLVIGGDARKRFPPARIDEINMTFAMEGKIQQMGDIRRTNEKPSDQDQTCAVIEPGMEHLITGYLREANDSADNWLIEPAIREDGLFVTPGVIQGNEFKMLVGNASETPITIYPKTALTKASLLTEMKSRLYEGPIQTTGEVSVLVVGREEVDLKDLTAFSPGPSWPFKSENEKKEERVDPIYKVDLSKCEIPEKDKARLEKFLQKYEDFLSTYTFDVRALKIKPELYAKTTEVPITYRDEIAKQIRELIDLGVCIERNTPWMLKIMRIPRWNRPAVRCLDFRQLNGVTVPDKYPILKDEKMQELIVSYYHYTTLDMLKGYDRSPREDNFSYKCGFFTKDEAMQLQTTARPVGIKKMTELFAKLIAKVLKGLTIKAVMLIKDEVDIHVKGQDFGHHLEYLDEVFRRLRGFKPKNKGVPICPTLAEQPDNPTLNVGRISEGNARTIEAAYHRTPEMTEPQDQCINAAKTTGVNSVSMVLTNSNLESEGHDLEDSLIRIRKAQREDPELELVFEYIESNVKPSDPNNLAAVKWYARKCNLSGHYEGILWQDLGGGHHRVVAPTSWRKTIFEQIHSAGIGSEHFGTYATVNKCRRYVWRSMFRDIAVWCKSCLTCQLRKVGTMGILPQPVRNASVLHQVGLDRSEPTNPPSDQSELSAHDPS